MVLTICESNMADQQDSATPPVIVFHQPSLGLDTIWMVTEISRIASIRDSFMYSAGINKDKETSRAGKNII